MNSGSLRMMERENLFLKKTGTLHWKNTRNSPKSTKSILNNTKIKSEHFIPEFII
jgi:hypothetical protein